MYSLFGPLSNSRFSLRDVRLTENRAKANVLSCLSPPRILAAELAGTASPSPTVFVFCQPPLPTAK
jgi:hypothetical protein